MTYSPGQVKFIFQHWPKNVGWFLLGGPADGDEAQCVRLEYPKVRCIGFEPCEVTRRHQVRQSGFPGPVLPCALWSTDTTLTLRVPAPASGDWTNEARNRSATVCRDLENLPIAVSYPVPARTLDSLSVEHGPFTRAVLWLDIEGAELEALRGASDLLERGEILMINVEVMLNAVDTLGEEIEQLLFSHGFERIDHWGRQSGNHIDVIYKLKGE